MSKEKINKGKIHVKLKKYVTYTKQLSFSWVNYYFRNGKHPFVAILTIL